MAADVATPPVSSKNDVSTGSAAPSSASRLIRPALVIAAACALLAAGGYYAWQTWYAKDSSAATLLTAVVTRGNLEDTVTATGTLQPKEFVDVGTQVSGQLKKLLVDVGAVVKAGQLLAEIDPSVYQAKVDGDRAQLLNQQAQLAPSGHNAQPWRFLIQNDTLQVRADRSRALPVTDPFDRELLITCGAARDAEFGTTLRKIKLAATRRRTLGPGSRTHRGEQLQIVTLTKIQVSKLAHVAEPKL